MAVNGKPAVYHVMSRTALDGFVLGDVEKEHLLKLIKKLSSVFFSELLGFCIMGNHLHVLLRMHTGEEYSDSGNGSGKNDPLFRKTGKEDKGLEGIYSLQCLC